MIGVLAVFRISTTKLATPTESKGKNEQALSGEL